MFRTRVTGVTHRGGSARPQRGAAAVEFALVLPLLLLLVFGIINFGFLMAQKASLSNSTRAGARYGTVNAYTSTTHTCQSVVDKVRASAPTAGIADTAAGRNSIAVSVKLTKAADGSTATVCSAAPGAAAATGSPAQLPCLNATNSPSTPDTLTVSSTYNSRFLVSIPGVGTTFALGGTSAFQCEYYK